MNSEHVQKSCETYGRRGPTARWTLPQFSFWKSKTARNKKRALDMPDVRTGSSSSSSSISFMNSTFLDIWWQSDFCSVIVISSGDCWASVVWCVQILTQISPGLHVDTKLCVIFTHIYVKKHQQEVEDRTTAATPPPVTSGPAEFSWMSLICFMLQHVRTHNSKARC